MNMTANGDMASARGHNRDQTRAALVESAIELFGTRGFDAASIRDIAAAAGANIASIGYHFGGKEGLRLACAQYAADFIHSVATTGFSGMTPDRTEQLSPDKARKVLSDFVSVVVRAMMTAPGAEKIVRFLLREIVNPSNAFQVIYTAVIEPTHKRLCRLWAAATGEESESDAVRVAVFAVMGQAVYFRVGQSVIVRRMGWQSYGPREAEAIAAEIVANLNSALDRHSGAPVAAKSSRGKRT
jgi:TetR/AcrR family transcriptional regulator, regulator of cefoperazone and chloramphenicol sensitivity